MLNICLIQIVLKNAYFILFISKSCYFKKYIFNLFTDFKKIVYKFINFTNFYEFK